MLLQLSVFYQHHEGNERSYAVWLSCSESLLIIFSVRVNVMIRVSSYTWFTRMVCSKVNQRVLKWRISIMDTAHTGGGWPPNPPPSSPPPSLDQPLDSPYPLQDFPHWLLYIHVNCCIVHTLFFNKDGKPEDPTPGVAHTLCLHWRCSLSSQNNCKNNPQTQSYYDQGKNGRDPDSHPHTRPLTSCTPVSSGSCHVTIGDIILCL